MKHPKTAILVLTHNACEVTERFLRFLYDYTSDFYLILVDNGSTDNTVDFLSKFAKEKDNINLTLNKTNLGVINGRNFAYEIYLKDPNKAEYLCFLDNDQFVQKGWLEHHFEVLEQSEADVVGVEAWRLSKTFKPVEHVKKITSPWSYIGCGGMLMKAKVPGTIGLFDPQFNPCYFEDPDFAFRVIDAGFKLAWNSKARVIHLPHQTLGKNPNKLKNFLQSYAKMAAKWKGRKFRDMIQPQVKALL
jgi:GT2 family glycosyltransferase